MDYRSRISNLESQVYRDVKAVPEWASETLQERPIAAVMTVFAAGLVVGIGCVAFAMTSCSSRRSEKSVTGAVREAFNSVRVAVPKVAVPEHLKSQLAAIWGT